MPEVITKHPDVAKQVLKSSGAKCAEGAQQKILKKCPRENFCAFPGGEICVYGVDEIPQMTQLTKNEICAAPRAARASLENHDLGAAAAVIAGVVFGTRILARWGRRKPQPPDWDHA